TKGGPYWDVRWRDPRTGAQFRRRKRSRAVADKLLAKALSIEAHGVELADQVYADVTFGWTIEDWWEYKYRGLAPNTRANWETMVKKIPAPMRKRPLRGITTRDIEAMLGHTARN